MLISFTAMDLNPKISKVAVWSLKRTKNASGNYLCSSRVEHFTLVRNLDDYTPLKQRDCLPLVAALDSLNFAHRFLRSSRQTATIPSTKHQPAGISNRYVVFFPVKMTEILNIQRFEYATRLTLRVQFKFAISKFRNRRPGVRVPTNERDFYLLQNAQTDYGAYQASYSAGIVFIPRPKHEVNHSLSFNARDKNKWSYTSSSPLHLHGIDRESFTFLS